MQLAGPRHFFLSALGLIAIGRTRSEAIFPSKRQVLPNSDSHRNRPDRSDSTSTCLPLRDLSQPVGPARWPGRSVRRSGYTGSSGSKSKIVRSARRWGFRRWSVRYRRPQPLSIPLSKLASLSFLIYIEAISSSPEPLTMSSQSLASGAAILTFRPVLSEPDWSNPSRPSPVRGLNQP